MKLTKQDLVELYVPNADAEDRDRCPSSDDLARSAFGEMKGDDRERIARHLIACRDCAEEYRLISPLKQWSAEAAAVIDESPTRRAGEIPSVGRSWQSRLLPSIWPIRPALAISAIALLICSILIVRLISINARNRELLGLASDRGNLAERAAAAEQSLDQATRERDDAVARSQKNQAEIAQLRDDLARAGSPPRPEFNVPIIDLDPRDAARGPTGEGGKDIKLPKGAASLMLILNITGESSFREYGLEIKDRAGAVRFDGKGLRRSAENTFTVSVPRAMLPPGAYRIAIYGLDGGRRDLVQDYSIHVH